MGRCNIWVGGYRWVGVGVGGWCRGGWVYVRVVGHGWMDVGVGR